MPGSEWKPWQDRECAAAMWELVRKCHKAGLTREQTVTLGLGLIAKFAADRARVVLDERERASDARRWSMSIDLINLNGGVRNKESDHEPPSREPRSHLST